MFKFRKLINASTGQRYYISKASLATDEYDWSENGGNAFTIDLQPLGSEDEAPPLFDLTLSVSNDGHFAEITRNLDKFDSIHEKFSKELMMPVIHEDMMGCLIEGDLLIVTAKPIHA